MTRRLLLSLLGSLILFFWGFVGHVALGLYDPAFHHFEDEAAVAAVVEANARGAGIHYLPAEPLRDGSQAEVFFNVVPAGERSGFGAMVGRDLLIGAVAVFAVLTLLGGGHGGGYWQSVGRFALAGFALGFVVHAYYWNWFDFPALYFGLSVLDQVIGWTLVGLALSPLLLRSAEDRSTMS
jgi:hypothetical protein